MFEYVNETAIRMIILTAYILSIFITFLRRNAIRKIANSPGIIISKFSDIKCFGTCYELLKLRSKFFMLLSIYIGTSYSLLKISDNNIKKTLWYLYVNICIVISFYLIEEIIKIPYYEEIVKERLHRMELSKTRIRAFDVPLPNTKQTLNEKKIYKPPKNISGDIDEYIERESSLSNSQIINDILKEYL